MTSLQRMTRIGAVLVLAAGLFVSGPAESLAKDRDDRGPWTLERQEERGPSHSSGPRRGSGHGGQVAQRPDHSQGWQRDKFHDGPAVKRLPHGFLRTRWGGREYYRSGHHYYERSHDGYVRIRPPVGLVVGLLPNSFISLNIGGLGFYLGGDVYYRKVDHGYVVVEAPVPPPAPVSTWQAGSVLVNTAMLNVRSGPGVEFPVIRLANLGERLFVAGNAPGWLYVQLPDGSYGWVMTQFTQSDVQG